MPKRVIGFPLELRNNEVHPAMEGFRNLDFVFVISDKPKRKVLKDETTRYSPGFSGFKKPCGLSSVSPHFIQNHPTTICSNWLLFRKLKTINNSPLF
jgi:hypothetical protein